MHACSDFSYASLCVMTVMLLNALLILLYSGRLSLVIWLYNKYEIYVVQVVYL